MICATLDWVIYNIWEGAIHLLTKIPSHLLLKKILKTFKNVRFSILLFNGKRISDTLNKIIAYIEYK